MSARVWNGRVSASVDDGDTISDVEDATDTSVVVVE